MGFLRLEDEIPDSTQVPKHDTAAVFRVDTAHRMQLFTHLCARANVSSYFPTLLVISRVNPLLVFDGMGKDTKPHQREHIPTAAHKDIYFRCPSEHRSLLLYRVLKVRNPL